MVQYWPLKIYFFVTAKLSQKLEKIVKIKFFRPLEINQNPATIWRLSLSKNSGRCSILTLYYYPLFTVSSVLPWRNKPIASQPMKGEGWIANTSQNSISRGQLLLICLAAPMGREEGSGWGAHVYLWWIHFDIWQN